MIFYIVLFVYFLAINLYGIIILHYQQKEEYNSYTDKKISNFKLMITAFLGAGIGIYSFMFIYKYKLKNLFFMVFIPLIATLNIIAIVFISRFIYGRFINF